MDGRTGLCDTDVISGTGFCNGYWAVTKVGLHGFGFGDGGLVGGLKEWLVIVHFVWKCLS